MKVLKYFTLFIALLLVSTILFSAAPIEQEDSIKKQVAISREAILLTKQQVDSVKYSTRRDWYKNQNVMIDGLRGVIKDLNETILLIQEQRQKDKAEYMRLLNKLDTNDQNTRKSLDLLIELNEVKKEKKQLERLNDWFQYYQPLIMFSILFMVFLNLVFTGVKLGIKKKWQEIKAAKQQ